MRNETLRLVGGWLRQTSTRTALLGMAALGLSAAEGVTTWRAEIVPIATLAFGLVFSDTSSRDEAARLVALAIAGKTGTAGA